MIKYNCVNLLEISRSAIKIYTKYHDLARALSISRSLNNESNRSDEAENEPSDSGSHRNYHRRSYEKKRSDYQRGRDQGDENGTRSISFMTNPSTTHYQRLNIDTSADLDSIKSAYYSLSKRYHPDIVGRDHPDAIESFRLITDAYDVLSDPEKKANYDKHLAPGFDSSTEPIFTAWKPRGNSSQQTAFRMRESHRIFRDKQDEALAREKERNPNKFRSGVFRRDEIDIRTTRERLDSQIQYINSTNFGNMDGAFAKRDGNELYRAHLYATLLRKRQDLQEHDRGSISMPDETLWMSLAAVAGILTVIALMTVNVFYNFDLADLLDSKISRPTTNNSDGDQEE